MTEYEKTYLVNRSSFEKPKTSKDLSLDHKFEFYKLIEELATGNNSSEYKMWASTTLKEMAERFPLCSVPSSMLDLQQEFKKIESLSDRYAVLDYSLKSANKDGLNLEFGVWTGDSLFHMASSFPEKTFCGFDAFDNIEIENTFDNVSLIKGRFEKTIEEWKKTANDKVAFMHIDADLYAPCRFALFELNDFIVPGTLIQFDELLDFNTEIKDKWLEGEWKALDEWAKKFKRNYRPIARDNTCRAVIQVVV